MPQSRMGKAAQWYGQKGVSRLSAPYHQGGRCSCSSPTCETPGKHPRILQWPENATTRPGMIRSWWGRWPEANIGLVTGEASRLVVLDVDPRHGGHVGLEELERQFGPLPATVEAQTGSGGRHLLFKHPGQRVSNSAGILGPGLDVRGDGGYIVVPPIPARKRTALCMGWSLTPGAHGAFIHARMARRAAHSPGEMHRGGYLP